MVPKIEEVAKVLQRVSDGEEPITSEFNWLEELSDFLRIRDCGDVQTFPISCLVGFELFISMNVHRHVPNTVYIAACSKFSMIVTLQITCN